MSDTTQRAGEAHPANPQQPSILSSAGAIGKQFNPDGAIGGIAQKVGGPFDKEGMVGSQFDAGQNGLAGQVERAVDGPSNPATENKYPADQR